MEVNNSKEIVQNIHKELSQILTENFYGKYVNNDTCSNIKRFYDEYCHKILAENVELTLAKIWYLTEEQLAALVP